VAGTLYQTLLQSQLEYSYGKFRASIATETGIVNNFPEDKVSIAQEYGGYRHHTRTASLGFLGGFSVYKPFISLTYRILHKRRYVSELPYAEYRLREQYVTIGTLVGSDICLDSTHTLTLVTNQQSFRYVDNDTYKMQVYALSWGGDFHPYYLKSGITVGENNYSKINPENQNDTFKGFQFDLTYKF